jgi:hypothetical protein
MAPTDAEPPAFAPDDDGGNGGARAGDAQLRARLGGDAQFLKNYKV